MIQEIRKNLHNYKYTRENIMEKILNLQWTYGVRIYVKTQSDEYTLTALYDLPMYKESTWSKRVSFKKKY